MIQKNSQAFSMRLVDSGDEAAARARALISHSFRTRLNAYPETAHQHYLIIETKIDGKPVLAACSSISLAHQQQLFSENYLSQPIQSEIFGKMDIRCNRSSICEIGSLSTNPTLIPSVKKVVAYFPWFAYRLGYEFALVTVTSYMRLALANSGSNFTSFCESKPEKLSLMEKSRWGKYYDFNPETGVIDLKKLDFLDLTATKGARPNEMVIELTGIRGVEVCS